MPYKTLEITPDMTLADKRLLRQVFETYEKEKEFEPGKPYSINVDGKLFDVYIKKTILVRPSRHLNQKSYEVLGDTLGEGAFGEVLKSDFLIRLKDNDDLKITLSQKAVKKFHAPPDNSMFIKEVNFMKEAYQRDNGHSKVSSITTGNNEFIVMPRFDGKSLEAEDTTNLSFAERLQILKTIMVNVNSLHNKGIIHRDLKFDNVIVNTISQNANVIDFGLSDAKDSIEQDIKGTPGYIAPEVWAVRSKGMGHPNITKAVDVYAIGMMAAELMGVPELYNVDDLKELLKERDYKGLANYEYNFKGMFEDIKGISQAEKKEMVALIFGLTQYYPSGRCTLPAAIEIVERIFDNHFQKTLLPSYKAQLAQVIETITHRERLETNSTNKVELQGLLRNLKDLRTDASMISNYEDYQALCNKTFKTLSKIPDQITEKYQLADKLLEFINTLTRPLSFIVGALSKNENIKQNGFLLTPSGMLKSFTAVQKEMPSADEGQDKDVNDKPTFRSS